VNQTPGLYAGPGVYLGPASNRSFTVYVYEMNTRKGQKAALISTLQYNFNNFGAIAVQF